MQRRRMDTTILRFLRNQTFKHNHSLTIISKQHHSNKENVISLYHHRLEFPSFKTHEIMFSLLFKEIENKSCVCDASEVANTTMHLFPLPIKKFVPFELIQSEIWRPSTIPNVSKPRVQISMSHTPNHLCLILDMSHIFMFIAKIKRNWI